MAKTITISPDQASIAAQYNWVVRYEYQSQGVYTYVRSSYYGTPAEVNFDLSNIPANATITSAVLTWNYEVVIGANPLGFLTGVHTATVSAGSDENGTKISIGAEDESGEFAGAILPNQTNTFTLTYTPGLRTSLSSTTNHGTGSFTGASQYVLSNMVLTVTYDSGITNTYIGVAGAAKEVNDMYVGVNGVARKVASIWAGVDGVARKVYP